MLMQLLKVLDRENIAALKEWMDDCENRRDAEELAKIFENLAKNLTDQNVKFTDTEKELFIQRVLKKNYQFAFQFALREAV